MSRTLMVLVAGLATSMSAGLAHAGPGDAKQTKADKATKSAEKMAEHKTLAELFADEEKPELWIGAKAPALSLSHFARGEAITSFEPGRTYIVEFWATWCGPCIAAFPHIAGLQEKYDDKLSVIGVNIWERAEGDARVEMVDAFVSEHTEMKYTVAIEEGTSMAENWMKPAGQNGIPAAFIVDGQGKVAWIGHPMQIDEPLAKVIAGEYDVESEAKKIWQSQLTMTGYMEMRRAVSEGEWDRAVEVAGALVHDSGETEGPSLLNAVAWTLLQGDEVPANATKLSLKAATMAAEKTEWKEWMILDTYALAAHKNGKTEEAIKWQTKAIELAPEEAKAEMTSQLESFKGEG